MVEGSDDIQALIGALARLPGLGPRSARRIVLTTPGAIAYLPIEAARHPDLLVLFKLD